MLREKLLGQPPHLNVVAAQPGQILHKHGGGLAGGKLLHHVVETGAVHRDAGDAVVQEVDQIGVSFFLFLFFQRFNRYFIEMEKRGGKHRISFTEGKSVVKMFKRA